MKHIIKSTLSVILILCMLITIAPAALAVTDTDEIAESYDARDYGLVTSVKSQGPYGTCWAHAVCAVAESNMIKNGHADINVDYSELQLAYFTYAKTNDPLGNYHSEGITLVGQSLKYTFLSVGGNTDFAGYTLMRGIGLVNESDVPYEDAEEVRDNGLSSDYAYGKTAARMTDIYYISYADYDGIKQAIIDNGAVCASLNDASNYSDYPCYNKKTAAYYNNNADIGASHAVTIVGWDDNYSVENFLEAQRPENPGAWLIKDSAGEDWGLDGYWWASYEDVAFSTESTRKVAVMKFDLPSVYERTYQYDGSSRNSALGIAGDEIYIANVFTSTADEAITSVSFSMHLYPDEEYSLYIYKNPNNRAPDSGTLVYSSEGVTPGGYITVPLKTRVELSNGDRFSVIISYSGSDENGYMWMDYDVAKNNDGYFSFNSYSSSGQSYYNTDIVNLGWTDYAKNASIVSRYGQANFRIKAHTVALDEPEPDKYTLNVVGGDDVTDNGPYIEGAVVAIAADAPAEGKKFVRWETSAGRLADDTDATTTITMPKDNVTVTAVYEDITPPEPDKYTLNVIGGDDVTDNGPYIEGAVVAIAADAPAEGKEFVRWEASAGRLADETDATTTITMPKDNVTVTAVYEDITPPEPDKYTLTIFSGYDVTADGPYIEGAVVAIAANEPVDGKRFARWEASAGRLADETDVTTTITMPKDNVTVTAVYEDIEEAVCIGVEEIKNLTDGYRLLIVNGYALGVEDGEIIFYRTDPDDIKKLAKLGDEYYWRFKESDSLWTIRSDEGTYLYVEDMEVSLSDDEYEWSFEDGEIFYSTTTGIWFFKKTVDYKLYCDGRDCGVSKSSRYAAVELYTVTESDEHDYRIEIIKPTCQHTGTETKYCDICGDVLYSRTLDRVDHEYGDDHRCIWCGIYDPDAPEPVGITVSASVSVNKRSYFFFSRYNVKINVTATGGRIERVQYSTDNGQKYKTGTSFTTNSEPEIIMLRITDSAGGITYWRYDYSTGLTVRV